MEAYSQGGRTDTLTDFETEQENEPTKGQIINITRNFGKTPLTDIFGRIVIKRLSQSAKSDNPQS